MPFISFLTLFSVTIYVALGANLAAARPPDPKYWRSQGLNPWCFAFAEEQVIKDSLCPTCPRDNQNLYVSVFDITIAQSRIGIDRRIKPKVSDEDYWELLKSGGSARFPYDYLGIQSLRASKCTLERPLLDLTDVLNLSIQEFLGMAFLNLRPELNINHIDGIPYRPISAKKVMEIKGLGYTFLLETLNTLANQSSSPKAFAKYVLEFTLCEDRIPVHAKRPLRWLLKNAKELESNLRSSLSKNRSVYLALCAEGLKNRSVSKECGPHAVVAQSIEGNSVLVVDSSFQSDLPKNADGTTWIPISTVINAVLKRNKDITRENSFDEYQKKFKEIIKSTRSILKAQKSNAEIRSAKAASNLSEIYILVGNMQNEATLPELDWIADEIVRIAPPPFLNRGFISPKVGEVLSLMDRLQTQINDPYLASNFNRDWFNFATFE